MSDEPIDRTAAEQTTKNLALARRFVREALKDPDIFDAIPDQATLVLMPPDDSELASANLHLAERLTAEKDVHFYHVGQPCPETDGGSSNRSPSKGVPPWSRNA